MFEENTKVLYICAKKDAGISLQNTMVVTLFLLSSVDSSTLHNQTR